MLLHYMHYRRQVDLILLQLQVPLPMCEHGGGRSIVHVHVMYKKEVGDANIRGCLWAVVLIGRRLVGFRRTLMVQSR